MNIHLRAADNIRALSVAMVEKAKSGHPGGAMGGADFIQLLFSEFLQFDPDDFNWPFRDRFFLDPGHMSPMLYSVLAMVGAFSMDDLKQFRQWGSPTPGHPELDTDRGVENTSGPLGQGHVMAVGAAIAEKFLRERFGDWMEHKIYTLISDGGIQEEISQGAGRIAGYLGLDNLVMFYDANKIQLATEVASVTIENTRAKYEAWGWRVMEIEGNDLDEIRAALMMAEQETSKPVLIIGNTIMGKGLLDANGNSFEFMVSTHGQPVSKAGASLEKTYEKLGADINNPFVIFDDVSAYYQEVLEKKRKNVAEKKAIYDLWEEENPDLAEKLRKILEGEIPAMDFSQIDYGENIATRASSSLVLGAFAGQLDNMIVMSADLANSDKTDGFLKKSKPITSEDFSGAFIHAGVSELTMAALANGMALHYIIPVCGTFFVFSDYMKPAVRMAALMELPVKYVWTHDSFRVGEDGPTHQPIEHEAQLRLMEKLKNHSGKNSLMVLRPADSAETVQAWRMALENDETPTALILSRQNVEDLPSESSRYTDSAKINLGGYMIKSAESPSAVLIANGSEVATMLSAASILEAEHALKFNIVSLPSEGVFLQQDKDYIESVLPADVPRIGLTAGLPDSLQHIIGDQGIVFGLDHFGYSAPASRLNEEFGFTADKVAILIRDFLKK